LQYIAPQDLRAFGMIPEIVGRLPVVTHLKPLDKSALRAILTAPKNAIIKQYIKLFRMDGIDLKIKEDVYDYIVDKAMEFKLGARGLRSIVEAIMIDPMFESPSKDIKEISIDLPFVKQKLENVNLQRLKVA